jgi:hypothetical protein
MAKPSTVNAHRVAKDVTINVAEIPTTAVVETTATVAGLKYGAPVRMWAEDLEANLVGPSNVHCSAANTLKFRLHNPTGDTINPASQIFRVVQD